MKDPQIVHGTRRSTRNHYKRDCQLLFLGSVTCGVLIVNAQGQKAPRAVLVSTPDPKANKAPRATLIATPAPTPIPVVVTEEDYNAIPVGGLYYFQGRLQQKRAWATPAQSSTPDVSENSTPTPTPVVVTKEDYSAIPVGGSFYYKGRLYKKGAQATPAQSAAVNVSGTSTPISTVGVASMQPSPLVVWTVDLLMLTAVVIGIWIYRRKSKIKPQSDAPPRSSKRPGRVYYDYDQFNLATQLWDRERELFEQDETARLAKLSQKANGPLGGLGCLGFIIAAFAIGVTHGAVAGWGTVFLGVVVVGLLVSAEERFYRWRHQTLFVRREFQESEPVYHPSQQEQHTPPPHTEERQSPSSGANTSVTSMRQAYEILGLPPGRTTLKLARTAYHTRIAEYHPDKVAHLGQELRELAARKALEINLAMDYVEEHTASSGGAV